MDLSKQYDEFAEKFSDIHDEGDNNNRDNRKIFYDQIDFMRSGTKLLDLACGDGLDLAYYKTLGAEIFGLDASEKLVEIARKQNPGADIRIGLFETIPFEDSYFDVVLSKYAIQTSKDMRSVFSEIHRILKPGGTMMYLVTHPLRQYLERKEDRANYFEQKIVDSNILNDSIRVKEPSHTFNEYLNDFLFQNFKVQFFQEYWDASAEQIDGKKYPGYFILKAKALK
jgi:ubiquinone/menaquinone biosynthesis C-methylase UbiE